MLKAIDAKQNCMLYVGVTPLALCEYLADTKQKEMLESIALHLAMNDRGIEDVNAGDVDYSKEIEDLEGEDLPEVEE